jgi:copper chaperone CopZ
MFSKGSRYRNLTESVFLNAKAERLLGKHLRLIRRPESNVLHTVTSGDRLDLLAYKYYGDTTKWWQISDANPVSPFPTDLLDQAPLVDELFVLSHPGFQLRYADLITELKNIGAVRNNLISYFDLHEHSNSPQPFESLELVEPSFLEETVLVVFTRADRPLVLAAIQDNGFHRLSSFGFPQGANLAEAFTIDDLSAKEDWNELIAALRETPGVVQVQSTLTEATLAVNYNSSLLERDSLTGLIKVKGFTFKATQSSRVGRKILVPPNQIV